MGRFALVACLALCAAVSAVYNPPAEAATRGFPITLGEHSKQVCGVLWLQKARAPSQYKNPRFNVRPEKVPKNRACKYTLKDGKRTWLLKYRLGYPADSLKAHGRKFGGDLRNILLGRIARPQHYMKNALKRRVPVKKCTLGGRVVRLARKEVGARESWGYNWGPRVRLYQAVVGQYRIPWCVAFAQAMYKWAGQGTFANRSAGVYYVVGYAKQRGWLRYKNIKPGYLVAFLTWQGHMGLVDSVTPGGWYSVEGNASDSVLRRFHPWNSGRALVFIEVPGINRKIKC